MIDPATGWFEMVDTTAKDAATIAYIVETTWLTRYLIPQEIIYDQIAKFLGENA